MRRFCEVLGGGPFVIGGLIKICNICIAYIVPYEPYKKKKDFFIFVISVDIEIGRTDSIAMARRLESSTQTKDLNKERAFLEK